MTFSYESHSQKRMLANPRIHRIRDDFAWSHRMDKDHMNVDGMITPFLLLLRLLLYIYIYIPLLIRSPGPSPVLQDYTFIRWDIYTIRDFMESFARSRKTDPLVPETWYNLLHSDLIHIKVCFILSLIIYFHLYLLFILYYIILFCD